MINTKCFAMKRNNKQQNNGKGKGHYQGLYEKYLNAAKEYNVAGDKVMAEYNLQHAEHYLRVMRDRFQSNQANQEKKQENQTCTLQLSTTPVEEPVEEIAPMEVAVVETEEEQPAQNPPKKRRVYRRKKKTEEQTTPAEAE